MPTELAFTDLADAHEPVSKLFPRPRRRAEWARYRLTDAQVGFFREHGYLAGLRLLTGAQVAALRAELRALTRPAHPGRALFYEYHTNESHDPARVLFHALGAWRVAAGLHDLLWHPGIVVPAAQLLGGAVRFWHDQLFCKPARHGGVVAWHQDYSYWTRTRPLAHLTCWVGLDDATVANGCVHYVPGSHRWKLLLPRTGLADDMEAIKRVLTPAQRRAFRPVAVELKSGECSFHHPLLVHGSYANGSARPRRATVVNVMRDGVESATTEPLLAGVPVIPPGHKIEGRFFPLLFDPAAAELSIDTPGV
ncbi:MAG TPA: phytanoyl-CoA dioxygenase family protein [Pyrinomonadaceae bacterium]